MPSLTLSEQAKESLALIPIADAALAFSERNNLGDLLFCSLHLVRELFPEIEAIRIDLSRDPDEDSQWLVVRVTSQAQPEQLKLAYREYVSRWVRETPAAKRNLVRLSCSGV